MWFWWKKKVLGFRPKLIHWFLYNMCFFVLNKIKVLGFRTKLILCTICFNLQIGWSRPCSTELIQVPFSILFLSQNYIHYTTLFIFRSGYTPHENTRRCDMVRGALQRRVLQRPLVCASWNAQISTFKKHLLPAPINSLDANRLHMQLLRCLQNCWVSSKPHCSRRFSC